MLKLFRLFVVLNVFLLFGSAYGFVDDRQITINSHTDVSSKRQALINFIWGASGFPSNKMPSVTKNVNSPVAGLNNLLRVDKLVINMDRNQQGLAYHFIPHRQNSRMVIVHNGHVCPEPNNPQDPFNDNPAFADEGFGLQRTINGLLTDGYSVLTVYMPYQVSMNYPCSSTDYHNKLFSDTQYAPSSGSPMQYFLEPVAVSLNYLKTASNADGFPVYQDFNMVGLSGGGWTTTVYSAIDPTIKLSIPVAGTMPLYNRDGGSIGDTEQTHDPFYQIAGYPDLYVLGSYGSGRKQVWLLNRRDRCCFGDTDGLYKPKETPETQGRQWENILRSYESDVRLKLYYLGTTGLFRLEIDEAAPSHMISWNAVVNHILSELNGGRKYIGASSSLHAFARGANGQLWHNEAGVWENTGCSMVGVAAAIEGTVNSLDVFYRDGGNRLMHAYKNGGGWTCKELTGQIISDPAIIATGSGSYDVVGFGGNYQLYRWHVTSASVNTYEPVNRHAPGLGPPSVVVRGPNQFDIFYRGFDRSLNHIYSNETWSLQSEVVGGIMLDFPSAVYAPDGSLRAYIRGQNNGLWEAYSFNGGPWSINLMWVGTQQLIAGSPSASVQGTTVRVHARQPAGNLSTFTLSGSSWNFVNNGGGIIGSPTSTPGGVWARGNSAGLWLNDGTNWIPYGGFID